MEPKHEPTDMDARWALYFAIGLVLMAVIIHFGVWWLYRFFDQRQESRNHRPSLVAPGAQAPPEPRLQVRPELDYEAHRARQMEQLERYEWLDRGAGTVRIPIDRAMEIVVERGRQ